MSINYLDTQNQDNLLFKKFQGVAQANINTDTALVQYSSEQRKALVNVFNTSIFSNDVPVDLSENYWVSNLDASSNVDESSWNGSGSINQTVGQMQTISKTPIPGTDLVFYKQVYLEPLAATNQAWFCRDPSGSDPQSYSIENNLLKDSIPFLYNDKEPTTYTPIVYYNDNDTQDSSQNWVPQQQNVPNSLNWVFDSASGILQFYQNDTILNDLNISKIGLDASGNPKQGFRPRISFIKYEGPKGASGSGGGGGGISDASYNQLVQDICANTVLIEDISGQLNRYLFEIPEAPTAVGDGFIVSTSSAQVTLNWTNPTQKRAALDFYQNINNPNMYPLPQSLNTDEFAALQERMNRLTFHNTLNLQFRSRNISGNLSAWQPIEAPNIYNSTYPGPIGPIFKDISSAIITANAVGSQEAWQDTTANKYYNQNYLNTSDVYQFRIALTNLVYEDTASNEEKWNYLYIPDASGEFIQLGSFGPPEAPNALSFNTFTFDSGTVSGSTLNFADASLNTPFPITFPKTTLAVNYKFDLTGNVLPSSKQYSANKNTDAFDVSFVSESLSVDNFSTAIIYSSTTGSWTGTNPGSLDVFPEHQYILDGSFCMFNIINNGVGTQFDPACILVPSELAPPPSQLTDVSQNTPKPTRLQANNNVNDNKIKFFNGQPSSDIGFSTTDISAYPAYGSTSSTPYPTVYFINSVTNAIFTADSAPIFAKDNSDSLVGIDTFGASLSKLILDCSNSSPASLTAVICETEGFDVFNSSLNDPSLGKDYIDTTSDFKLTVFNNDLSPGKKKGGYYSFLEVKTGSSDTTFTIRQSTYDDSATTTTPYSPYTIRITQESNANTSLPPTPPTWNPVGQKLFNFLLAHEPTPINFNATSTSISPVTTSQDFFGLKRPSLDTSNNVCTIRINYELTDRNIHWRGTGDYEKMTVANLAWNKTSNGTYPEFDSKTQPWASSTGWGAIRSDSTSLIITRDDLGFTSVNNNSYSRKGKTSSTAPINQFEVALTYANNVPLTPTQIAKFSYGGTQPLDISFNNLLLFWDYTWRGNTSWISGAILNGPGLTSTLGYNPTDLAGGLGPFGSPYDHTQFLYTNQLMWSGSEQPGSTKGAFRNGNYGSNNENPYINYTSYYENTLALYSSLDTLGDSVSITYSKNGLPGDYYDDFGVTSSTVISGIFKWIVLEIPKTITDPNKIKITVNDIGGTELILGEQYMLFICEEGSQFTNSNSQFLGRTGWKDASRKFDTQLGNVTQNTDGAGIYVANGNGKLQLFSTNTQSATLYLKIGLANKNSTTNTNVSDVTTQISLASVTYEFS